MAKTFIVAIHPDEIHFEFVRSSGPGGQNVNKVATAVQLRFDIRNSRSLPQDVKERMMHLAGKRLNRNGEIVIEASRFRSQQMNREDALERLHALAEKASVPPKRRRRTKPSRAAKRERLEEKRRRSESKQARRRPAEID